MNRRQRRAAAKLGHVPNSPGAAAAVVPRAVDLFARVSRTIRPDGSLKPRVVTGGCPNHADALNMLGVLAHQMGRPDLAVVLIRQAIDKNETNPTAHFHLGCALCDQGQLDAAAAAYREAVRNDPAQTDAYCNLGNVLREQGKLDDVLAACRQAIRLDPDLAAAHCNLDTALQGQGKLDEAIAAMGRPSASNPTWPRA
jgi:protein O-GlcNAc transferase